MAGYFGELGLTLVIFAAITLLMMTIGKESPSGPLGGIAKLLNPGIKTGNE